MLGLGLKIPRLRVTGVIAWLKAFIDRVKGDGGTVEGKKCVQVDGTFLIENKRANIIVDYMGDYAISQGGEGLEARVCSAQAVNDLLYDPKPQAKFMFLAQDEGLALENYYCLSNDVDALEGALAVFGEVTHTYGADVSNGRIALTVENGVEPYTYSWSNGSTVRDITGLTKGEYRVQVTDSLGAIANNSFTVRGDADASIVTAGLRMDSYFTNSALEFPALGSAEFNGTSDYIDMGEKHIANDLGITNAFTFGAWANYNADGNYDALLTMWNNGGARVFWFGFDSSELFHYNISLTGGDKARNIVSVPTNDWVYVNLTYDGSNLKLYLNGSNVDTLAATGTINGRGGGLTETLLIGAQDPNAPAVFFNGNLANVAIWNRALHPDEINSIMWKSYSDLNAVDKNGLQAWYALDDITGTTVPDSTGNHNGTAN